MEKKEIYESPLVEVVEVHVEQGFANSVTNSGSGEGGTNQEW